MTLHWLLGVCEAAADVLVAGTWQGVVLAAAVGLCLRLSAKISAATRFTIWIMAFVVLTALPFLRLPLTASEVEPSIRTVFHLDGRWSLAIAALWMVASLFRAWALARNGFRLRKLWRSARPLDTVAAQTLRTDPVLSRGEAEVCTSSEVDQPSVIGFFSPRILIPAWLLEKLTEAELQQIVLHEREHLRRRDDWLNLFQKLGLVLFPLNPVLMWIEKRLCTERELACDDGVVRATRVPGAYATCLTSLAGHGLAKRSLGRRTASLSLGAWEPAESKPATSALARRVYAILRQSEGLSPLQSRGVTAAVLFGLVLGGAALSRCPRLVSFSSSSFSAEVRSPAVVPQADYPTGLVQNVSFRESRAESRGSNLRNAEAVSATPKLIDATLVSSSAQGEKSELKRVSHATRRRSIAARQLRRGRGHSTPADRQNWLVVTSWEDSNSPNVVLTVVHYTADSASGTYLPASTGWILFQL